MHAVSTRIANKPEGIGPTRNHPEQIAGGCGTCVIGDLSNPERLDAVDALVVFVVIHDLLRSFHWAKEVSALWECGQMFVAGQPTAFLLFFSGVLSAEHNGFALLAKALLPLHAQLGGNVMDKNRDVALQTDVSITGNAAEYFKPLQPSAVPQRLIGIARQQRLFEGEKTKLASALK